MKSNTRSFRWISIPTMKWIRWLLAGGLLFLSVFAGAEEDSLNVVCSAKPQTCEWIKDRFVEEHGIATTVTRMSSGAVLKKIEEESNSGFDVWWGGTGDTHLKAVTNDRLLKFTPTAMQELMGWSTHIWELSDKHTIGVYSGTLGIIANEDVLSTQNLDLPSCWSDLGDPKYRGQIIIGHPRSSGTAYTFLSTIFQIYDQNQRNQVLAEIKENIKETTSSGHGALTPVARGEAGLSIAFVHDVKPLVDEGYPLKIISPCEGTGYEIGAASILKTTNRAEDAQRFIEYTQQPAIQNELTTRISLQMFSNVRTERSAVYIDDRFLNVINYDFYIYSRPDVRADVLSTWDRLGK